MSRIPDGTRALAEQVADRLGDRQLATAESCTAGRVAEVMACVERATDIFRGGLVAYQEDVKRSLLGVTADSVFTERAAVQMAAGVASLLDVDVAVATTGVAGGQSQDGTPPGTVYIATSVDGCVNVGAHRFEGSPEDVCDQATDRALQALVEALSTTD